MKRIQTKDEGNALYPLPPDYQDLTTDGQRQARVNACRQWLLEYENASLLQDAYVASLWFFDAYYLWPDHEVGFNPVFYDDEPVQSADFHWIIARQWISNRKNISIAPRGGAKSYLIRKDIMLRMLSCTYSFVYATSTHPNCRDTGDSVKRQYLFNDRILHDWSPEMPEGRIAPRRNEGSFSTERMVLMNGSWIRFMSAQSRQRGIRVRRYKLDDPEYDPKASTSMSTLRDYMEELLFKIVRPMVTRPNTGVDWIGTYISKRHYLWHAMQQEEGPEGLAARDPRFNRWARLHIPAALEDETGSLVSCWETMWPATIRNRKAMALMDRRYENADSLEELRLELGTAVFNSEMMGKPGDSTDSFFKLDQDVRGRHAYWFTDVDDRVQTDPLHSVTRINWYETTTDPDTKETKTTLQSALLREFLASVRLFITADTSYSSKKDSDFKVALLHAINNNNDLFAFDLWAGQCAESKLIRAIFAMCDLWRVPSIHPEVVKESVSLFNSLMQIVVTRATDIAGTSFLPSVRPIRPGLVQKTDKIAGGLLFRFEHNKIKLPLWRRMTGQWRRLFDQIDEFNPDVQDGGLEKDDHLDTLAMSQFVLKGRLSKAPPAAAPDRTLKQRLLNEDFINADGTHIGVGLDLNLLSYQDVEEILDARTRSDTGRPSRI